MSKDFRSKRISIVVVFLFATRVVTAQIAAQMTTVSIPAERDNTLEQAHQYNNDGAWGWLWIKIGNGENRIAIGFDITPLSGQASNIVSASVRLVAGDHTFTDKGTSFSIYAYDPRNTIDWVEGNERFDLFTYCDSRIYWRPPASVGGTAMTWRCEADANPNDGKGNCLTPWSPATQWVGGFADLSETHVPRGFRKTATDTRVEKKGFDPLCKTALNCYSNGGGISCWRSVNFDVTKDIREFIGLGYNHPSWLVARTPPATGAGGAHFFSREGAMCIFGIPGVRPMLVITFASPVALTIPEPPPHCGSYGSVGSTAAELPAAIGDVSDGESTPMTDDVPQQCSLGASYPNPFNPSTTIRYTVAEPGPVSLKVFNALGQQVTTLISGEQSPGEYRVHWDAAHLPTGVYVVRMESHAFVGVEKLILIK